MPKRKKEKSKAMDETSAGPIYSADFSENESMTVRSGSQLPSSTRISRSCLSRCNDCLQTLAHKKLCSEWNVCSEAVFAPSYTRIQRPLAVVRIDGMIDWVWLVFRLAIAAERNSRISSFTYLGEVS